MEKVNVEEIMKIIKSNASQRRYPGGVLEFEDLMIVKRSRKDQDISQFDRLMDALGSACILSFDYPIVNNGLKGFLKRIARRYNRFALAPLIEQQNEFNKRVVECLDAMYSIIHENTSREGNDQEYAGEDIK